MIVHTISMGDRRAIDMAQARTCSHLPDRLQNELPFDSMTGDFDTINCVTPLIIQNSQLNADSRQHGFNKTTVGSI